jgi:hypothetical protein
MYFPNYEKLVKTFSPNIQKIIFKMSITDFYILILTRPKLAVWMLEFDTLVPSFPDPNSP